MDLDAQARDLAADVGRMRLGQWNQYFGAHRRGLVAQLAEIGLCRRIIDERARRLRLRAHPPQHAAHVGVLVDGDRTAVGRSEEHTSELQSLMRISYAVFCLKKKNRKETYAE